LRRIIEQAYVFQQDAQSSVALAKEDVHAGEWEYLMGDAGASRVAGLSALICDSYAGTGKAGQKVRGSQLKK